MAKTKLLNLGIKKWRIVFWITFGLLLTFSITPRGYAQSVESEPSSFPYKKIFMISSYYTPLPNQNRYFTGSYESDVRLNGEGITAADGTKVYPGIAAASKQIPFGTKMEIPGFGTVAIHDRGGAIKGDRLDIWVGAGEEGLRRAIGWGMRTLEVTVYGINDAIQESVNFTSMPLAEMSWIIAKTDYFKSDLGYGDEGESVMELQRTLKQLGYFSSDATGYFGNDTQNAVKIFQLAKNVIAGNDDPGVGNFGPKSRIALERTLKETKTQKLAALPPANLKLGDTGETVMRLQNVLKEYGFSDEANGTFDRKTYDALMRFQLDFSVIAKTSDVGAGFYGPKTLAALKELISDNYMPAPSLAKLNLKKGNESSDKVFTKTLAFNDRGSEVKLLQEELKRLNFLRVLPTGYFGNTTKHAVFKFQQAFDIVKDETETGVGVAGPKTIEKLNEIYQARTERQKLIAKTTDDKQIIASRIEEEKKMILQIASRSLFSSDLNYGSRGNDVEQLQKILKRLGFFKGRFTTAYFGDVTKSSLVAFQKSHGVDESGSLDEITRRMLNSIISDV